MRLRLRHKVGLFPIIATVAFLVVVSLQFWLRQVMERSRVDIRDKHLPALERSRDLEHLLGQIQRALQEAVGSNDEGALAEADKLRDRFHERLAQLRDIGVRGRQEIGQLAKGFRAYYALTRAVTGRTLR